ncbi:MAG: D-alanyl-lipoteichoic acid acyltransferase DltB (MBOAT superfamily) [Alcanivorax sp.]|jgi:D-alanyl-lipoteichoic acid acyltransferase DltB (MBOAT superfamily)
MLFNSIDFIFIYLPLIVSGFLVLLRFAGYGPTVYFMAATSLAFYGYWKPAYAFLIITSMLVNYSLALMLRPGATTLQQHRSKFLILGISFNVLLLGYYKYSQMLTDTYVYVTGINPMDLDVVLPLAISFFTFQQIAYLVDTYRGKLSEIEGGPAEYALFVTFFPQLIAGPIVHYRRMVPQFRSAWRAPFSKHELAIGISIFLIGLFKKVGIADSLGEYSLRFFERLEGGYSLTSPEALGALLSYTLEIYFDFSGYSDMAIGLARMFGIRLPINFYSPYKSGSVREYWRRWNITLGTFFREYVYLPLGGSRKGEFRANLNNVAVMTLSGLWHGAGWNFIVWGFLHGAVMVAERFMTAPKDKMKVLLERSYIGSKLMVGVSRFYLFVMIMMLFAVFRLTDLDDILYIWKQILSFNFDTLQAISGTFFQENMRLWERVSQGLSINMPDNVVWSNLLLLALLVVFFMPNTYQLFAVDEDSDERTQRLTWKTAILVGALGAWAIILVLSGTAKEFIYFAF